MGSSRVRIHFSILSSQMYLLFSDFVYGQVCEMYHATLTEDGILSLKTSTNTDYQCSTRRTQRQAWEEPLCDIDERRTCLTPGARVYRNEYSAKTRRILIIVINAKRLVQLVVLLQWASNKEWTIATSITNALLSEPYITICLKLGNPKLALDKHQRFFTSLLALLVIIHNKCDELSTYTLETSLHENVILAAHQLDFNILQGMSNLEPVKLKYWELLTKDQQN